MKTRSGKQIAYVPPVPRKSSPMKPRSLQASGTIEVITPSLTGLGKKTVWLRPSDGSPHKRRSPVKKAKAPAAVLDPRFVTPEPYIPTEAPPLQRRKLVRSPDRMGPPGIFGLAVDKGKVLRYDSEDGDSDIFDTPTQGGFPRQPFPGMIHRMPRTQGQPLLGPEGTMLVNEKGQPILASPLQLTGSGPRYNSFGGDTVIIEDQQ